MGMILAYDTARKQSRVVKRRADLTDAASHALDKFAVLDDFGYFKSPLYRSLADGGIERKHFSVFDFCSVDEL